MNTSYFVETIGNDNEEVIRQYVQNQLKVMEEMKGMFEQLFSLEPGRKRPSSL